MEAAAEIEAQEKKNEYNRLRQQVLRKRKAAEKAAQEEQHRKGWRDTNRTPRRKKAVEKAAQEKEAQEEPSTPYASASDDANVQMATMLTRMEALFANINNNNNDANTQMWWWWW